MIDWIRRSPDWTGARAGPGLPATVRPPSMATCCTRARWCSTTAADRRRRVLRRQRRHAARGEGRAADRPTATSPGPSWRRSSTSKFKRLRDDSPQLLTPAEHARHHRRAAAARTTSSTARSAPTRTPTTGRGSSSTARRGGRVLYAFDVTDPDHARSSCGRRRAEPATSPNWGRPGPSPRRIKVKAVADPVLIFGAGYDPGEDLAVPAGWTTGAAASTCSTQGRAPDQFLQAAVQRGQRSRARSPSDVAVVDIDGDTYVDRAYVGDLGGNVWRMTSDAAVVGRLEAVPVRQTSPTGRRASSSTSPTSCCAKTSTWCCSAPATARSRSARLAATGSTASRTLQVGKDATGMTPILRSDSSRWTSAPRRAGQGLVPRPRATGEKVVNSPLTIGGRHLLLDQQAAARRAGHLLREPRQGTRLRAGLPRRHGGPTATATASKNQSDLFVDLTGGGLPPSPVGGIVQLDDGRLVGFVIGGGDERLADRGGPRQGQHPEDPPEALLEHEDRQVAAQSRDGPGQLAGPGFSSGEPVSAGPGDLACGRGNVTLSSIPSSSRTRAAPSACRRCDHLLHQHFRRRGAGGDADVRAPAIHSGRELRRRGRPCRPRTPRFSATSRRRLEFELLGEPTTITTSQRGAMNFTASWRFCVA